MLELRSANIVARFSALGARLTSCVVDGVETAFGAGPDDNMMAGDIFAGAVCGRHAGRISKASFPLDGKIVQLKPNYGAHQLHGGETGFHSRRWDYLRDGNRITFMLRSGDGEEGFPGILDVSAAYVLGASSLSLTLEARTTKPTVCNLTNHAYWNMAGGGSVLDHELTIPAQKYFPLDDLLLPLGEIKAVAESRWDFRRSRSIGGDYDNCFLLDGARGEMKHGVTLRDPLSRRALEVRTSEGCMQIYTAIHWQSSLMGQRGPLAKAAALAIEPQNIADAPNHPNFPSSILRPGETYRNRMEWRFS